MKSQIATVKASVIIPTKNPGTIFSKVLLRVLEQQTDFSFDVLVIDSGSTDGTQEYVRAIVDPRLRLMEIPSSEFGHGKTRNLGIASTQGEFAVLITHDAMPASDGWLASLVHSAEKDTRIAGVFGRHIAYPEASILTKNELEMHFSGFVPYPVVWNEDPVRYAEDVGYRQFLHFFSDNNALVRRSVWREIPYPNVDFAEDQIWAQKIIEAGWKKAYSHEATVFHSHDFKLFDRLQRSFDESYAFLRLFNYELCPSIKSMVRNWMSLSIRDLNYLFSNGQGITNLSEIVQSPIDNFMRSTGHYLGTHGDKIPDWIKQIISRDRRMHAGQVMSK